MIYLWFSIVAVVSYLLGTINFSRIISWHARRRDITKIGSKNPGTMNMLRSYGVVLGFATLIAEVVKSGLCCWLSKFLFEHVGYADYGTLAFYFSGLFVVLGYDFPVWFKFKGGKGVAVFGGMFLFGDLWWLGLSIFAFCFILLLITDYGFISSFVYLIGMSTATTIYAFLTPWWPAWAITAICWFLVVLTIIKHRGNMVRFAHGVENRVGFRKIFKKFFEGKPGGSIDEEEQKADAPQIEQTENK